MLRLRRLERKRVEEASSFRPFPVAHLDMVHRRARCV
jgi:hypothetical protein